METELDHDGRRSHQAAVLVVKRRVGWGAPWRGRLQTREFFTAKAPRARREGRGAVDVRRGDARGSGCREVLPRTTMDLRQVTRHAGEGRRNSRRARRSSKEPGSAGNAGGFSNFSSVAAQTGGVVGRHYAASKAGILGLTHSDANLLAKEGITSRPPRQSETPERIAPGPYRRVMSRVRVGVA